MKSFAIILASLFLYQLSYAADGRVKVYILAGQSNMEGHAKVETFDYIGDDPATAPLLQMMRQPDGTSTVADHTWISYLTGRGDTNGEGFGKLTSGYGSRPNPSEDGGKIGPEFTFGLTLEKHIEGPILIIKTAWGGKSIYHDFRPPSAGVYPRTEEDIEKDRLHEDKSGHYYRLMMEHVKMVLSDISRVIPGYDNQLGYELGGFVWFQGWNDMVNRSVYPIKGKDESGNRFAKYSQCLEMMIKDVRSDLKSPELPFVIGVMGVGGKDNEKQEDFRLAMAEPAKQMKNVVAVQTSEFWDEPISAIQDKREKVKQMSYFLRKQHKAHANKNGDMTPQQQREYLQKFENELIPAEEQALLKRGASNAGYHYLGCAKTFARMGQAYAEVLLPQ